MTLVLDVRSSEVRWRETQRLLRQLAAVVQANAMIDAAPRRSVGGGIELAARVDEQIDALAEVIDQEVTRLTVEQLAVDLAGRQRKGER